MRNILGATLLGAACLSSQAIAATIDAPVPVNATASYMGKVWAWASPCGNQAYSCSSINLSYQAALGWRLPTATEVATFIAPDVQAFINAFFYSGANFSDGTNSFACAAAWFDNTYGHCDDGDARKGYVWNLGLNGQPNPSYDNYFSETFLVKDSSIPAPVPVPAAFGTLAFGLAALGSLRKTRRKAA